MLIVMIMTQNKNQKAGLTALSLKQKTGYYISEALGGEHHANRKENQQTPLSFIIKLFKHKP